MPLTPEQTAHAAFIVKWVLAQRRRFQLPVRPETLDCFDALLREVSANGQQACQTTTAAEGLETTAERAERLGLTERTVRRQAKKAGHPKTGRQYLFRPEDE